MAAAVTMLSATLAYPGHVNPFGGGDAERQAPTGLRYGHHGSEPWTLDDDTTITYNPGSGTVSETLPDGSQARIWQADQNTTDTANLVLLDSAASWYVVFTLPGAGQLYAIEQERWLSLAALTTIPLWYVLGRTWRRWQPTLASGALVPPIPPVVVDSSGGGVGIVILYGSNPYTIHVGWGPNTKTLDMAWLGFGPDGLGSYNNYPSSSAPEGIAVYPGEGTDWKLWNFDVHANAGDHWPLPYSTFDRANGQGGPIEGLPGQFWPPANFVWDAWKTPAFGVTDQFGRFDAVNIWDRNPPMPAAWLLSNVNGDYTHAAFSCASTIDDRILIRGKVSLPVRPTDTLTNIAFRAITDHDFGRDLLYLNDAFLDIGYPAGFAIPGDTGSIDITASASRWQWNQDNLVAMLAVGKLAEAPNPAHHTACSYIDVAFQFDNGTNYATAPAGWEQKAFPADTWTPSSQGDPGGFFGRNLQHSITYGFIGARSRYYSRSTFVIPPGTYTSASLAITARTGIGAIYLNNNVVAIRDETIDLWDTSTVLTFPIPLAWLLFGAVITNVLSIQAYTADGNTAIDFQLSLFS